MFKSDLCGLIFACAALAACGAAGGASYSGRSESPRANPEFIADGASLPLNYERLGSARASCTLRSGFRKIAGEKLSDVDCSFERLTWALRERAAQVGGELLLARRCHVKHGKSADRSLMLCQAGVARRTGANARGPIAFEPSRPAPSALEVQRIDEPSAESAWFISVEFVPVGNDSGGPSRHYASVAEVATMPISHVALGDVMTSCDSDCSVDTLRHGLRIAAGRLGASDVVDVRCFRTDEGRACTGTAAIAEIDR